MSKKFSLNKLMHNDRLMIIFSLIVAVVLWATIVNGAGSEKTSTISVPVAVNLSNPVAQEKGLQVISPSADDPVTVNVTVKGQLWLLAGIKEGDITVTANTAGIYEPGNYTVDLTYKSNKSSVEIVGVSPETIMINCDYWQGPKEYTVHPIVSGVSVPDTEKYMLGEPVVDTAVLPGGKITIEGPKSITDRIAKVAAVVMADEEELTNTKVYEAQIKAYDINDAEITELNQCKLSTETVSVTVPVLEYHEVKFTYELENVPKALDRPGLVKVTPPTIEFWAPPDTAAEFAERIENLGTFDFDNIRAENATITHVLDIPQSVQVTDGVSAVEVKFNIASYTYRTFELSLDEALSNLTVLNPPEGREYSIPQPLISNIRIYGPAASLNSITVDDLMATVDMQGNSTPGPSSYEVRITVKGHDDVWVYYGAGDVDGYSMYITVK